MNSWNQAPLVRLLLPFLAGIIIAAYFPYMTGFSLPLVLFLMAITSSIILVPLFRLSYGKSWWLGISIQLSFFLCGYQLTITKTGKLNERYFARFMNGPANVYVRLSNAPIEKEKSFKVVVTVLKVKQEDKWKNTSGEALLYLPKDTLAKQLKYGDELLMRLDFKEIPPPKNPEEFNYKQYLSFHNIYHQAFSRSTNPIFIIKNSSNPIVNFSLNTRNKLLDILTKNQIEGEEFSVGAALLLGYEDKLEKETISAYSSTGALHILSVSGLHVAIVYVFIGWLLSFLNKVKHGLLIKAVMLLLSVWFYALITGLSPSVLRSATMFSFIITAKTFRRDTNIYNTLAASAFLLLLIDPYLVLDVGFQLSYLAVIGIVCIHPKLYECFEVKNQFLDKAWIMTSVSVAAQISTFPLALFYFHQFPNYFLLSNLIVIPLSTLAIYMGISLLVLAKISIAANYLSVGFDWLIWLLNTSVKEIEQWPYALLEGISITVVEACLIYSLIIALLIYFSMRKVKYLIYSTCILSIIFGFQAMEQYQQLHQKKLIIYNIPKASVIDFIDSKNSILLSDSIFIKNEQDFSFHIQPNHYKLGITVNSIISDSIRTRNLFIKNRLIQFYTKRIAIINHQIQYITLSKPIPLDYVIISNNAAVHISNLTKVFDVKTIIFDSSNSMNRIKKWEKECVALQKEYYSVPDKGALVVTL